jgi:uncharacterized protein YgiM (DUF1202 family)
VKIKSPDSVQVGSTYRVKVILENYESDPVSASSSPTVTIYDSSRDIVSTSTMTEISTGVYETTYNIASNAESGLYETKISIPVGGSTLTRSHYWTATGAPSQVIINSVSNLTVPSITASFTIRNEGNASYEYQYEWCVVKDESNDCGGGDDVAYGSAAKLVSPGADFDTEVEFNVSDAGSYWFKVVNHYGLEYSTASRSFVAVDNSVANGPIVGSSAISPFAQLQITADQLKEALQNNKNLNIEISGLNELLQINERNAATLKDIQNKLSELKAISETLHNIISQNSTEPIVQTFMQFNSVELHFLITNPAKDTRRVRFKAPLPKEVTPEDIMDTDGLSVEYDPNAQTYFVSAEIELAPGESLRKKVEIKDIWIFDPEKIASMRQQAKSYLNTLSKTQYSAQATLIFTEMDKLLDELLKKQAKSYDSPQNHIIVYRTNQKRMQSAEMLISKLRDMVTESGVSKGLLGSIGGIQTFAVWGIVLVVIFGFAFISAVIFAMWRQQNMLIMALGRHGKYIPGLRYDNMTLDMQEDNEQKVEEKQNTFMINEIECDDPETLGARVLHAVKVFSGSILGVVILISFPGFIVGVVMFATPAFIAKKHKSEQKILRPLENYTQSEISKDKESYKDDSSSSTKQQNLPGNGNILVVTQTPTGWLNARFEPSLESDIMTKLYPGEKYTYDKQDGMWYRIKLQDKFAWVHSKYVSIVAEERSFNTDDSDITQKMQDKLPRLRILDTPTGFLNLRENPSIDASVIDKLKPGETYFFDEENDSWVHIQRKNSLDGWIYKFYIEKI